MYKLKWRTLFNGEFVLHTHKLGNNGNKQISITSNNTLKNLFLPALGIGLGLTALINGAAPSLILASIPVLANVRTIVPNEKAVPAQVLFTDEYKKKDVKFFYKDVDRIINSLPSDFEENDAIYRGMTLDKFEDLKRILIKGLQVNKSNYNYIYFSKDIETAIDYSTEYDFGHLPIIVKMCSDYYSKLGPVVKYSSDISASDIDEVIVWAELDGKLGWWRAVLDASGKVILQPTDNMEIITTKEKRSEEGITLRTNIDQKYISAKVLFEDEGKNFSIRTDDPSMIPSDFEEEGVLYRGMALNNYEDLKRIFKEGLQGSKTVYGSGKVYFTDVLYTAIGYSLRFEFGDTLVLIKTKKKKKDSEIESSHFFAFKNISSDEITDIMVFATLDGKKGWWRAQLDGKGEVVLTPTDNMKIIE